MQYQLLIDTGAGHDKVVWEGDDGPSAAARYADHVRTTPGHKHQGARIIAWRSWPRTGVFPVNPHTVSITE